MPPGDPPTPLNETSRSFGDKNTDFQYYSKDDWFVERIVNYNEISSDIDEVLEAVRYWKQIADDLVQKKYPLSEGINRVRGFDHETIIKGRMLDDFLDMLINKKSILVSNTFDKLRILVAQGETFNKFKSKMKKLDFSLKCNEIWENDAVAYRCNTCALSPCMSLCEACFDQHGHKGHDFTRFFSREGGACDCGNADVIKPDGFCNRHGSIDGKPATNFLDVSLPQFIITKLIVRLFLEWRGWYNRVSTAMRVHEEEYSGLDGITSFNIGLHCDNDVASAKLLINFIQECVNFGGPMRELVSQILIDEDLYTSLTEKTSEYTGTEDERIDVSLDWRSQKLFYDDRMNLLFDDDDEVDFPELRTIESLTCKTLLDELLFWVIRQIFPQNLVNFSLSMLSEIEYRDAYAIRFFTWYPLIGKLIRELCRFQDDHSRASNHRVQNTCSRIIHVSVQMLSSGVLCKTLNEKCKVVKSACAITSYLLCERVRSGYITLDPKYRFCRNEDDISLSYKSTWNNMQCEYNSSIAHHGYWFVMGDMQNLLSHEQIAVDTVLDDETFVGVYVPMLKKMQAMHEMWRIVYGAHQETDVIDTVQQAYTLEFETLSVTLFNMVVAIQRQNHIQAAIRFFDVMYDALNDWLIHIVPEEIHEEILCQVYAVSFHIPIHRHLSTALTHFYKIPGFREHVAGTLLCDENLLRMSILHPLRIQVAREEIACGMWVRNGGQARIATLIYAQANVNNAFQIPDIDLIRYCAAHVNKEWLIATVISTFYLDEKILLQRSKFSLHLPVRLKLYSGVDLNIIEPLVESPSPEFSIYQDCLKNMDRIEFIVSHFYGDLPVESFVSEEEREIFKRLMDWENNCTTMYLGTNEAIARVNVHIEENVADERLEGLVQGAIDQSLELLERDQNAAPPNREMSDRIVQNDVHTPVLLRLEWMDAMVFGMFKILAEIIVIRVNSGASLEEQYRTEMINYLASSNMTHSKLRSYITEKGSRGNELIDQLFDNILDEIADFIEPDYNISQSSMHQGIYCLKQEILENETCPIFCMMRASNQRIITDLFTKLNALDKEAVSSMEMYKDVKCDTTFWPPFKMISFDKNLRHEGISNLYSLLITEHLILSCIATLHYSYELKIPLHENAVQLAVYLLTLGVKYCVYLVDEEKDDETILYIRQIYHTPFKIQRIGSKENTVHTVFSYMFKLFESEAKRLDCFIPLLKKILNGDLDTPRIYGGASIYLARFLTILANLSPTCRQIIKRKRKEEEIELLKLNKQSELLDKKKQAAREASKRRQMMILEQAKRRNQQMMESMMKKEGMSKEEVDNIDTKQLGNFQLYDCPICGENSSPNTLNSPFGMFARFSTNFLAEEQKNYVCNETKKLLEMDSILKYNPREIQNELKTRRSCVPARRILEESKPEYALQFSPTTGTDLKTCGHTAHISCFNAYRMSVSDSRGRETRDIGCPMCRFTINTIVPIAIDHDHASENKGPFSSGDRVFEMIAGCKEVAIRRHPIESDKAAFEAHYSAKDNGALRDIVVSRKRTSDIAERHICDPRMSPSTTLLSMATASVERSSILRWNNVPEKRKNARKVLTEHLLSSSVACIPPDESNVALSVVQQLLSKQSVASCSAAATSPKSKMFSGPKIEGLDEEAIRCLTEMSSPSDFPTNFIDHKSVPLLMFEPRSIFTRIVSLIVNNWELSRPDKGELCHQLLKYFVQFVCVRGTLLLLLRMGSETLKGINEGTKVIENLIAPLEPLPQLVANSLKNSGEQFYKALLLAMESTDDSVVFLENDEDFVNMLHMYVLNFIAFGLELLHHVNIYTEDGVKMLHRPKMTIRNALHIAKINQKQIIPAEDTIQDWINSFQTTISWNFRISSQPLLTEPLVWKTRHILELPQEYNQLFSAYFHRECLACSKSPSNPMICLMCSRLLCLDDCCKLLSNDHLHGREPSLVTEIEKHAEECSSSSGVFLSLNSSLIIIVRGRQAAIWGSVYLDSHGEEDRNLKRGKPLILSERRFECLENDWLDQEWQRVHIWMQMTNNTLIEAIRDSHHSI